jgi:hypothetical protein
MNPAAAYSSFQFAICHGSLSVELLQHAGMDATKGTDAQMDAWIPQNRSIKGATKIFTLICYAIQGFRSR